MTDDKTADTAAAKWTFTAPKDGEECWKDLAAFSDKDCKTAAADVKVAKTLKVGAEDKDAGWKLTTCTEKELTVGTGADYKTEVKVDVSAADKGSVCAVWAADKTWVKMTLSGWSDGAAANDTNATGAKSLAAAVAAGALAVAATQF